MVFIVPEEIRTNFHFHTKHLQLKCFQTPKPRNSKTSGETNYFGNEH